MSVNRTNQDFWFLLATPPGGEDLFRDLQDGGDYFLNSPPHGLTPDPWEVAPESNHYSSQGLSTTHRVAQAAIGVLPIMDPALLITEPEYGIGTEGWTPEELLMHHYFFSEILKGTDTHKPVTFLGFLDKYSEFLPDSLKDKTLDEIKIVYYLIKRVLSTDPKKIFEQLGAGEQKLYSLLTEKNPDERKQSIPLEANCFAGEFWKRSEVVEPKRMFSENLSLHLPARKINRLSPLVSVREMKNLMTEAYGDWEINESDLEPESPSEKAGKGAELRKTYGSEIEDWSETELLTWNYLFENAVRKLSGVRRGRECLNDRVFSELMQLGLLEKLLPGRTFKQIQQANKRIYDALRLPNPGSVDKRWKNLKALCSLLTTRNAHSDKLLKRVRLVILKSLIQAEQSTQSQGMDPSFRTGSITPDHPLETTNEMSIAQRESLLPANSMLQNFFGGVTSTDEAGAAADHVSQEKAEYGAGTEGWTAKELLTWWYLFTRSLEISVVGLKQKNPSREFPALTHRMIKDLRNPLDELLPKKTDAQIRAAHAQIRGAWKNRLSSSSLSKLGQLYALITMENEQSREVLKQVNEVIGQFFPDIQQLRQSRGINSSSIPGFPGGVKRGASDDQEERDSEVINEEESRKAAISMEPINESTSIDPAGAPQGDPFAVDPFFEWFLGPSQTSSLGL